MVLSVILFAATLHTNVASVTSMIDTPPPPPPGAGAGGAAGCAGAGAGAGAGLRRELRSTAPRVKIDDA